MEFEKKSIGEESSEGDALVHASEEGWIYALSGWQRLLSEVPDWGLEDLGFVVKIKGRVAGVMPLQLTPDLRLVSTAMGSSGLVLAREWSAEERVQITREVKRCVEEIARERDVWALDFSTSPDSPSSLRESGTINPWLAWGFEDRSTHTWMLDLRRPTNEIFAGLGQKVRWSIREPLKKGYSVRKIQNRGEMDLYYDIHRETYSRTGAHPHPKEYFLGIYDWAVRAGLARIWVAIDARGNVVGFINIALWKKSALYWTSCCRDNDYPNGVYYLLLWRAIEEARAEGVEWFDCGEAFPHAPVGSKERGLSDFKRKFGGVLHPYHKGRLLLPRKGGLPHYSFPQRVACRLRKVHARTESVLGKSATEVFTRPFRVVLNLNRKIRESSDPSIPFLKPFWSEEERAIGFGNESVSQDAVEAFKTIFREKTGCPHEAVIVPMGSGRGAVEVILRVLKEKHPGRNEVILPSYGDRGSFEAVVNAGLTPVFSDINQELLVEEAELIDRFSEKTLAVLLVHLCGKKMNGATLTAEAARRGIATIENHCQNLGGIPQGEIWPELSVFSFGLGKNAMATAGGALVANTHCSEFSRLEATLREEPLEIARRRFAYFEARYFRKREFEHLKKDKKIPEHPGDLPYGDVAMNRLDALLMIEQLRKLETILAGGKKHALRLRSKMEMFPSLFMLQTAENHLHTKLSVRLADRRRVRLFLDRMNRRGIEWELMHPPLHLRHFASVFRRESLPFCEKIYPMLVNLPSRPNLTLQELEKMEREIEAFGYAHAQS